MPPFTSTSWTTLLRRAVTTARSQVVHSKAARRAALFAKKRIFNQARTALHETFPSLSQPTFPRLQPNFHPKLQPIPIYNPLQGASARMRMNGLRSNVYHSSPLSSRVGFNPSRNFSTTVAASNPSAAMVLRGFYGLKDDDLKRWKADRLPPVWSTVISFPPRSKRYRKHRRQLPAVLLQRRRNVDVGQPRSIRDVEYYFQPPQLDEFYPVVSSVNHLDHITEDATTTLYIRCIPASVDHYDIPRTHYHPSDLGIEVFADLCRGIPKILEQSDQHSRTRVSPLIARLKSLGLMDEIGRAAPRLSENRPEGMLQITFPHRSAQNIRDLIGEVSGEAEWYFFHETTLWSDREIQAINGIDEGMIGDTPSFASPAGSVASSVSASPSRILEQIPDVDSHMASGFSTPEEGITYQPLEIGTSNSELRFPDDMLQSLMGQSTLTPPTIPYESTLLDSPGDASHIWSENASDRSMSSSVSSWATSSEERGLAASWGEMSEASTDSISSPERRSSIEGTEEGTLYRVMMPFY